jgi:hypothetical protein
MPSVTFDTLTGSGGPVDFTTSTAPGQAYFDTLFTSAVAQAFRATASTTFAQPTLTVEGWNAANTAQICTFSNSFDRQFQDGMSDTGSGQITLLDTDATLDDGANVVRFKVDDTYAFSIRLERKQLRSVAAGEESDQIVELAGRGLVAEWEDAVVYPYGGLSQRPISDSRAFSWACPELSTDGWPVAVTELSGLSTQQQLDPPLHAPWFPPLGWPSNDLEPSWIWSRGQNSTNMPAGSSLFRATFTAASTGRVSIFYTADSRCRVWLDGVLLSDWTSQPNERSFLNAYRSTPMVSAGTHTIAIEGDSQAWLETLPGSIRGIVVCAVYSGGVGGTFNSSSRLLKSDSSWKCLDYPTVYPAPTPGKILSTLLAEAQARGALTGWSLGCTDTVDSAGQPWPVDAAYVFRVGDTYLSVLKALADVSIDFRARPVGKCLDVWIKDTVTQATGVTFTAGGDIVELEETLST